MGMTVRTCQGAPLGGMTVLLAVIVGAPACVSEGGDEAAKTGLTDAASPRGGGGDASTSNEPSLDGLHAIQTTRLILSNRSNGGTREVEFEYGEPRVTVVVVEPPAESDEDAGSQGR